MQIDTNPRRELIENHPYGRELNDEEKALYTSAKESVVDGTIQVFDYEERNEHLDAEDPELSEAFELIEDATTLCEMIEELAVWRLSDVDWQEQKRIHQRAKASESNEKPEGIDE